MTDGSISPFSSYLESVMEAINAMLCYARAGKAKQSSKAGKPPLLLLLYLLYTVSLKLG